ncbi:Ig-like domain-containing protein, partial [Gammaproteobacteria bacterium AB-CW1]|nr:Ig-like domain-containing protein [Gammaproteobacteria bacterium AB-CW1]
ALDSELSIAWTLEIETQSGPPGRGRGRGGRGEEQLTLRAYDFDGARLMSFSLDQDWASELSALKVEPGFGGRIWLQGRDAVHVFDVDSGVRASDYPVGAKIKDITLDPESTSLYVATADALHVIDRDGQAHAIAQPDLAADESLSYLAWDQDSETLWLASNQRILFLQQDQVYQSFQPPGVGSVRGIAPDGEGGIWLARPAWLTRYSAGGAELTSLQPFAGYPGAGGTRGLTSDGRDKTVWPHSRRHVRQFDGAGVAGNEAAITGMSGEMLTSVLFTDRVPPEIEIASPAEGSYHNDPSVPVQIDWYDIGTGVDEGTLHLELNALTWEPECYFDLDGAECLPSDALEDGEYTLNATVEDFSGNESETASVSFMIDTVSPSVMIESPADGEISNDARYPIGIAWTDAGSGVDSDTVEWQRNDSPWPVDCSGDTEGADCMPRADLPDGEHTLAVRV